MQTIRLALIERDDELAETVRHASRRIQGVTFVGDAISQARLDTQVAVQLPTHADALIVAGHSRRAVEIARHAASMNIPVLLLPPVVLSWAEIASLEALFQSHGVSLMVGMSQRFRPSVKALKLALDRGQLGQPALLRIHAWDSLGRFTPSDQRDGRENQAVVPWPRLTEQLDIALWFFGRPPESVLALGSGLGVSGWPGHLQVHLSFGDGRMALISVSAGMIPVGNEYSAVSVIGASGSASADDFDQMQLVLGDAPHSAIMTSDRSMVLTELLKAFAEHLRHTRAAVPGLSDAVAALRLTESVRDSWIGGLPLIVADI